MSEPDKYTAISEFEKIYIRLREREGRIYTHEELKNLPEIADTHSHFSEWQLRKESSEKLITHLTKKKQATRHPGNRVWKRMAIT